MLHKMKALSYDQWVDAQMIYAYQRYGTNQQYSVAHAIVLETMDSYEIGKSMKKIIKEGNYKGLSVISEEQVIKAAETLLSESK